MHRRTSWFGIDFGTTNSAVVSFTGTEPKDLQLIPYGDGEGRPLPSVVAINREDGSTVVGREAKDSYNVLQATHEYVASIKSMLDSGRKWNIAGVTRTAVDVAAEIFRTLKSRVERDGGQSLDEAVVAVPVGFSAENRKHLRAAAKKAGIAVKAFISEPTAALCSNLSSLKGCKNVAVFDWGGGTLDVVIARITDGTIEEIASRRLDLAGNHIDALFAERIHSLFMRNKENPISFEKLAPATKDMLVSRCERAKCSFDDTDHTLITLNKYADFGAMRLSIDYDYFDLFMESTIKQAIECLQSAIEAAGLNSETVDKILCVGGSSKLRPLRERLEKLYGDGILLFPEKVMWDIAKGAAQIARTPGKHTLARPMGMLLADGSFLPLIKAGTSIPVCEEHLRLRTVEGGVLEACLVITDDSLSCQQTFSLPFRIRLRGFDDELIDLSYYIDEDSVFWLKGGSNRIPSSAQKVLSYEQMALLYHVDGSQAS